MGEGPRARQREVNDAARAPAQDASWWDRIALWRAIAAAALACALAFGALQWWQRSVAPEETLVVVLSGDDGKPGLLAAAARADRYLTLRRVGNATPSDGKVFELWALPQAGAPQAIGVIPNGSLARVPLARPADESLSSIPRLAVSLEPPGGSPTGKPTGPVVYSGTVERMY